jgi:hypothetical protein
MITGVDLSVLLAFANLGMLIWFARQLSREARADLGGTGARTPA